MSSDPTSWSAAIQSWYDESLDFVYGVGPKSPNAVVGHYTQVRRMHENTYVTNVLIGKLLQIMTTALFNLGEQSEWEEYSLGIWLL